LADYSIAALHIAPKSSTIDHGRIISPSGNQKRFWRDLAKRKGHRYLKSDEQVHQSKPFFSTVFFYGLAQFWHKDAQTNAIETTLI
jgi:hypothetical protein